MDTLNDVSESGSFGMDLAKTFALSAASTCGLVGGMFIVGLVLDANKKRKSKKAAKASTTEE